MKMRVGLVFGVVCCLLVAWGVAEGYIHYYGTGVQLGPVFVDWLYLKEPHMWKAEAHNL